MRINIGIFPLVAAFLIQGHHVMAQYPPGQRLPFESNLLPSSATPPVIPAPSLPSTQTLSQFRVNTFKEFVRQASQPQYRSVDAQMCDLKPLADFLLWVADLPATPETTAFLKTKTRPLPNWSILYGRVAEITDRSGILLWKYEQPEMSLTPTLVRLRSYPQQSALVDGKVVVVFAKNEVPFSYIDSQHNKSTVNSYDFGQPATKQQFNLYLQRRPARAVRLPPQPVRLPTNLPPVQPTP